MANVVELFPNIVADSNAEESHSHGIRRSKRNMPPAHYTLKIESFSRFCELLEKTGLVKYESDAFASGGYNWKLVLYPSGNVKRDGSDHISLYLAIAEPNAIPPGSQVDVILKFFVFDHLRDEYLTIQDDNMRRYHSLKTENGFDQLISLKMFNDSSNGYLFGDCCAFGAEVHVIKYEGKVERFYFIKELKDGDPRASGKSLSLFLELLNNSAHPQLRVYSEYKLIVKDQVQENHHERTARCFKGHSQLNIFLMEYWLGDIAILISTGIAVELLLYLLSEGLFWQSHLGLVVFNESIEKE
ncbi:hypothetical protein MANES_10G107166v8 [Manihot esculenta]|uniref:Uncharacterized protein n=1 Tax=Manihot esculenta TaxID=3983 RepID=A0ACB7H4U0_MANES|nr:hypothetical protein MANES_10G107166v8 [Manihot esculenta]